MYSQSSQVDPFDRKVGTALPNSLHEHAQGGAKGNLARVAGAGYYGKWTNLQEHVDQPNVYWARNCSDTPWTVGDVPLLHIGAAGKAVPLQVASERDIGAASSFAAIPQHTLGCASVGAIVDVFSGTRGAFWWGRGQWRSVLFAWVFGRAHELAMDFHRHQQSQLFGLYMAMSLDQFDSATALSKETSDENLYGVEADAVEAQVASVREDGLTHFICLTFDMIVWMFSCTRQFAMCPCVELGCCTHDIERALSRTARAPLSLDGKWRIYFGKKANPMVLHLSGTCVSHRDTPVPTEDTTSLQPSHSRLQVASLREDGRAHTMHLFVFEHIAFEVFSVARPNAHLCPYGMYQSGTRTSLSSDMMTPHLF